MGLRGSGELSGGIEAKAASFVLISVYIMKGVRLPGLRVPLQEAGAERGEVESPLPLPPDSTSQEPALLSDLGPQMPLFLSPLLPASPQDILEIGVLRASRSPVGGRNQGPLRLSPCKATNLPPQSLSFSRDLCSQTEVVPSEASLSLVSLSSRPLSQCFAP